MVSYTTFSIKPTPSTCLREPIVLTKEGLSNAVSVFLLPEKVNYIIIRYRLKISPVSSLFVAEKLAGVSKPVFVLHVL